MLKLVYPLNLITTIFVKCMNLELSNILNFEDSYKGISFNLTILIKIHYVKTI